MGGGRGEGLGWWGWLFVLFFVWCCGGGLGGLVVVFGGFRVLGYIGGRGGILGWKMCRWVVWIGGDVWIVRCGGVVEGWVV